MNITAIPFQLQFKKPFQIAHGLRLFTETTFVKAEHDNITGWGEAATPPYFHENPASIRSFVESLHFDEINSEAELFQAIGTLHAKEKNFAAKAAVEMALLDWFGKKTNRSVFDLLQIPVAEKITTAYTIGIGNEKAFVENIAEAAPFRFLKIKMGSQWDNDIIDLIPTHINQPFAVDANQGWKDKNEALEKINRLAAHGALFVEQPMPVADIEGQRWLKAHSPLPLFADEAIQTMNDLLLVAELFHGINIKLVKCGGLTKAVELIHEARKLQLKILIGCMSESSCAVTAAAHLATLADYVDLDGPFLISNNPFSVMKFENGSIIMEQKPGMGIEKIMPI